MKITHYDLFAGIGGFSYALDQVFYEEEIKHIFCEWEAFPTAVLKKHWPEGTYYGDIADLVADTHKSRFQKERAKLQTTGSGRGNTQSTADTSSQRQQRQGEYQRPSNTTTNKDKEADTVTSDNPTRSNELTILTGGFPCQPFSHAGRRKGTSDDRYKWPEMFAVIRNVRPDWVIAENVRGLASWNDGMVLETVCADLESEGYEVRPYIIPACSKGAPHRRERVWIVANRNGERKRNGYRAIQEANGEVSKRDNNAKLSNSTEQWSQDWREVALATCHDGVDDGLPRRLDGATYRGKRTDCISAAQHRKERLKACGNAIVPQVAMELFKSIKIAECGKST